MPTGRRRQSTSAKNGSNPTTAWGWPSVWYSPFVLLSLHRTKNLIDFRSTCGHTSTQSTGIRRKSLLTSLAGKILHQRWPVSCFLYFGVVTHLPHTEHSRAGKWLGLWCLHLSLSRGDLERRAGICIFPVTYAISTETDDLGNWQCDTSESWLQVMWFGGRRGFFVHTWILDLFTCFVLLSQFSIFISSFYSCAWITWANFELGNFNYALFHSGRVRSTRSLETRPVESIL